MRTSQIIAALAFVSVLASCGRDVTTDCTYKGDELVKAWTINVNPKMEDVSFPIDLCNRQDVVLANFNAGGAMTLTKKIAAPADGVLTLSAQIGADCGAGMTSLWINDKSVSWPFSEPAPVLRRNIAAGPNSMVVSMTAAAECAASLKVNYKIE